MISLTLINTTQNNKRIKQDVIFLKIKYLSCSGNKDRYIKHCNTMIAKETSTLYYVHFYLLGSVSPISCGLGF